MLMFFKMNYAQQNRYDMLKTIKHSIEATMPEEAKRNYYGITFASNGCNFEILVNDIPVYRFFDKGGATAFYPINPCITSSGEQRIKIRIYPITGFEDKGIMSEKPLHLVVKYLTDPSANMNEAIEVISDFIPKVKIGISFFEYETTFYAEVPYRADSLTNFSNLENTPEFKEKLIRKYNEISSTIITQNFQKLSNILAYKFGKLGATLYLSDEATVSQLEEMFEEMKEFTAVSPMSDFDLKIYGYGKLAILENPKEHELGFEIISTEYSWHQLFLLGIREGQEELEVIN